MMIANNCNHYAKVNIFIYYNTHPQLLTNCDYTIKYTF